MNLNSFEDELKQQAPFHPDGPNLGIPAFWKTLTVSQDLEPGRPLSSGSCRRGRLWAQEGSQSRNLWIHTNEHTFPFIKFEPPASVVEENRVGGNQVLIHLQNYFEHFLNFPGDSPCPLSSEQSSLILI